MGTASLFDLDSVSEREAFARRLSALVAPVAAHAGAVADDPRMLDVARRVYEAFAAADGEALTRAEIVAACAAVAPVDVVESRVNLFENLGMLLPRFDKAHQQRYVLNPTAAVGLTVFERLAERGGVDELVMLLSRVRAYLAAGSATREQVLTAMTQCQQTLAIMTAHLVRLVSDSPLALLKAESKHYTSKHLDAEVTTLQQMVTETFPDLDPDAKRLLDHAQRFVTAQLNFVERLLREGAAVQDFSLLDPEEYRTAALAAPAAALAQVASTVVFDPPVPWLDPAVLVDHVLSFRPAAPVRRRPPRPADPAPGDDPLARLQQRAEQARVRRERAVEILLQGGDEAELVSRMQASWRAAASILVNVLGAHADPDIPVTVTMTDELLVDSDGPVTYLTPITVHRTTSAGDSARGMLDHEEATGRA